MRLTESIEKLSDSASIAVKAGNEAAAKRNLEEKSRVMNALENARQRAGVLETLAGKLREVHDLIHIFARANLYLETS